jgi:hypothetical protein
MGWRSRGFVILFIVAFVSGGFVRAAVAGQPCPSQPVPPIAAAHENHAAHHHSGGAPAEKADVKCCSMCIVASAAIMPLCGEVAAARTAPVDYPSMPQKIRGHFAALDPGIPKRPI